MKKKVFGITKNWTHAHETPYAPRALRYLVTEFNDNFGVNSENDTYIVSTVSGYRLTNDLEEIREAIERDERKAHKALNRIKRRKARLKQLETRKLHGGELV